MHGIVAEMIFRGERMEIVGGKMEKFNENNETKTLIYLIRHGESIGNLNKICLGHTDLGLTERGKEQARATANALSSLDFAGFYTSDLIRAVQTIEPHMELRSIDPDRAVRSAELRELYFGEWENAAVEDLKNEYGDMFTVGWRQNFGTFTPPQGESVADCADRMNRAVAKIASLHVGRKILVVSHAAAIRALWGKILGLKAEDVCSAVPFPSNASYSILEYDVIDGALRPIEYSVDTHLSELRTALPS